MEDADHVPDIREGMDSRVTSKYGPRKFTDSGFHYGTDYAAPNGTTIYSKADGVVEYVNFGGRHTNGPWGNHIIIDHGNGLKTYHMHMSQTNLQRGTPIFRGQPLGLSGSTGTYLKNGVQHAIRPHYHYAVRVINISIHRGFVDPQTFDWYWHQKYGVPYFPKMW